MKLDKNPLPLLKMNSSYILKDIRDDTLRKIVIYYVRVVGEFDPLSPKISIMNLPIRGKDLLPKMTQQKNQLDPLTRLDNIWHYLHP